MPKREPDPLPPVDRTGWKKGTVTFPPPSGLTCAGLVKGGLIVTARPKNVPPGELILAKYAVYHAATGLLASFCQDEDDGLRIANVILRYKGFFLRTHDEPNDLEEVKVEFAKEGWFRKWGQEVRAKRTYIPVEKFQ